MANSPQALRRGQPGLSGVIMPGLAQVAPAFNLFFTTGVMVALAGVGLRFGVRVTVALYLFEVVLLLALSLTILVRGGASGLSATPFHWPGGSKDVLLAFSLAVLAFGGFEAAAPLAEETRNPRRNVPLAVVGAVLVSGIIYVLGSYALVTAFGVGHAGALAADPNPFHTAAKAFVPFVAPLGPYNTLPWLTLLLIAAGVVYAVVLSVARPAVLQRAPALLEGEESSDLESMPAG
jgi:amino acid transporter